MEQYAEVMKGVGVGTMKEMKALTELEIEKLPIPPGYRIKIKKAILVNRLEKEKEKGNKKEEGEAV